MSGKTAIIDPKFGSAGGYLVGRSHANNGIKAVVKTTGQPIEMQGGEVVITEPAVADNTKREFNGEMLTNRQILSRINESGGGVSFADGGEIPTEIVVTGKSYKYGGKVMRDRDIVSSCGCKHYEKGGPVEITNFSERARDLRNAVNFGKQTDQYAIDFCGIPLPVSARWVVGILDAWPDQHKLRFVPQADHSILIQFSGKFYNTWRIPSFDEDDENDPQPQLVRIASYDHQRIADMVAKIPDDLGEFQIGWAGKHINSTKEQIIDLLLTIDGKKYPLGYVDNGSQWKLYHTAEVSFEAGGLVEGEPVFSDEFLPKTFEAGGQLPGTLTEAESAVVQMFKRNPRGHVSLFDRDLKDLPNLLAADLVHATGRTQSGNMDVFLTDKGESVIRTLKFEDGGEVPAGTPGEAMVIEAPSTGKKYTYFKGTAYQYENPFQLNKAIEDLLDHNTNDNLTADQKQFLRYYSGYGGLEKFGAEGVGLLYEYFTPAIIAEKMWGLAYKHGYKGGAVLEPSCGIGEFFKYLPEGYPDATGFEINKYSARIANILYPKVNIITQAFEEVFIKNRDTIRDKVSGLKKYDLVIGNPPYGKMEGKFAGMGEKAHTKANNYVDYFISRGLDLLNPGGLLIYIIGVEVAAGGVPFLAQRLNPVKDKIIAKSDLLDAYRLPNGVFDRTDVLTDIIVLKKK